MLAALNALSTGLLNVFVDTWPLDSGACEANHAHDFDVRIVQQIKNGAAKLC